MIASVTTSHRIPGPAAVYQVSAFSKIGLNSVLTGTSLVSIGKPAEVSKAFESEPAIRPAEDGLRPTPTVTEFQIDLADNRDSIGSGRLDGNGNVVGKNRSSSVPSA